MEHFMATGIELKYNGVDLYSLAIHLLQLKIKVKMYNAILFSFNRKILIYE